MGLRHLDIVRKSNGFLDLAGVFDGSATQTGERGLFDFVAGGALASAAITIFEGLALAHWVYPPYQLGLQSVNVRTPYLFNEMSIKLIANYAKEF